jgi:ABC-type antimicrobial peptide transport system permease subunit
MTCWRNVMLSLIVAIPLTLMAAIASTMALDPPLSILVSFAGGIVIGWVASGMFGPLYDETCS